jgi:tetratricopeptide (TPR) repeat protein
MALFEPYAPCVCGSGEKYKWCCHKAEAQIEKVFRLRDSGQVEALDSAIEEGARRFPDNTFFLLNKALLLQRRDQPTEAQALIESVVAAHPSHVGAQYQLIQLVFRNEGIEAGVARLQKALTDVRPDRRAGLLPVIELVASVLSETGFIAAARRHIELASRLAEPGSPEHAEQDRLLRSIESTPGFSPWLRQPYRLSPPPEGLPEEQAHRFRQALDWADEGLLASAAAAFQALAADGVLEAERNLGLCRLWLADHAAAVEALRRYVARIGETTEAVDLEALCQIISPPKDDDLVDRVHLIWTLRDREGLLAALRASDRTQFEGTRPLDEDDPNSFEIDEFQLLDRPRPPDAQALDLRQVPRVLARILVAREIVMLEAFDDGRLDDVTARFTDLAGSSIPPAQPRTKELGKLPRVSAAMRSEWWVPPGGHGRELAVQLRDQERSRLLNEIWPNTPMPYLGGRTPAQAAQAGDARVALRAALCVLEHGQPFNEPAFDFAALRRRLGIELEPEYDPATVDIAAVPLPRLHLIPAERLDDERLVALYNRARQTSLPRPLERAARALIERPRVLERLEVGFVNAYLDLARFASLRGDKDEAVSLFERGRQADPAARTTTALAWDLAEIRLHARIDPPEIWVPKLAVVLDRYQEADKTASESLVLLLLDLGLLRVVPHPDDPDQMMLDSRPLQAMLAEYGPRITTATGDLGISAAKGGLWTPGSEGGTTTPGGIWTPGSPAESSGEKKLIIPGR